MQAEFGNDYLGNYATEECEWEGEDRRGNLKLEIIS